MIRFYFETLFLQTRLPTSQLQLVACQVGNQQEEDDLEEGLGVVERMLDLHAVLVLEVARVIEVVELHLGEVLHA